ncbi:hypothetical protein PL222_00870 [Salmonella enterica]|uniref:hypothetical protein n=1 Tax=Salmonella enterica TaxID=28901 RepID=UPI0026DB3C78|nr:hypothetical protein [Salmonella enterica]MDO3814250.1 hypothetical protein [Salmonella enterica]MDO3823304.1 hypothetical protein [Salmonella enterica]
MINDMTQYGNNLAGNDPLSVMSNGQATPDQIKQLYEASQQQQDFQGLGMSVVNPDTLNTGADIGKARAEFQRNGLPEGVEKPSTWGKLEDMLGSLLLSVAMAGLLGMDGKGAIGIGLMAAGSALDLDNAKAQRYDSIMSMDRTGINPAALVDYFNTGNTKGLQHYEDERDKREDAAQALQDKETYSQWEDQNILQPRDARQHDYRMQEIAARPLGRLRASGGLSGGIGLDSNDDARAQTILARNYDTMTGKEPTQRAIDWAKAHMAGLNGVDPSKQLFTITGTHKDDMSAEKVLNDFSQNYRKANTDLHKAQQADARMNAVDTSTPIGQVAAAYQFLTVEAPTISNTVATATGVSDEAVNTWSDKIQQILQKGSQAGSFTEQEISDMKYAAQQETKAMHDMAVKAAAQIAQGFNMNDVKTATAVSAATGIPASEILAYWNQIGYEQGEPETSDSSTSSSSNKTVDFTSLPK